jgi:hypothetical protein
MIWDDIPPLGIEITPEFEGCHPKSKDPFAF